jgi:hypothetical protein
VLWKILTQDLRPTIESCHGELERMAEELGAMKDEYCQQGLAG